MILGTAGHIDHGKTTLVRALTGVDTDRLPEERRRGITIELGFAPLTLDEIGTIGIVDVPGHEAFVRTMLAGATGVDLALLVIAADEGVMPQTREHLAILSLLGVRAGVVALTKRDLVDDDWLALVDEDVRATLTGSPLEAAPIIPVSAAEGHGVAELRQAIADAARGIPSRDAADLFRMPVDRSFSVRGTGTVVTGTVWSGSLRRDDVVRILPAGVQARVRGIQTHGATTDIARPGTRAAIALAGAERDEVVRGAILVSDAAWQPSAVLRAEVVLLSDAPQPLRPRSRVRFHLGTADVGARVVALGGALGAAGRAPARVILDEPVVARAGDRFVLRSASPLTTIGGGIVTDPFPPGRRARPFDRDVATPSARFSALLAEAGIHGVEESALPVRVGASPVAVAQMLERTNGYQRIGSRLYSVTAVTALGAQVVRTLSEYHRAHPLDPGASLGAVRAGLAAAAEVADAVVRELSDAGEVEVAGGVIRRPGWAPRLTTSERQRLARLRDALSAAGREPPSVGELEQEVGDGGDVMPLLRLLEREGTVVAVEPTRFYDAAVLESLLGSLRAGMQPGREYAPAELRDVLGVSRKFMIPLLEFADRRGITVRRGSGRVVGGTQLATPGD